MIGKIGEIAVSDVLVHELPGGVDVLFGGCHVLVHVQVGRWFVCDAKNLGCV